MIDLFLYLLPFYLVLVLIFALIEIDYHRALAKIWEEYGKATESALNRVIERALK